MAVAANHPSIRSRLSTEDGFLSAARWLDERRATVYSRVFVAVYAAAILVAGIERFRGFLSWEKITLLTVWLLPLFSREIGKSLHLPMAPLVMALLLTMILRRVAMDAAPPGDLLRSPSNCGQASYAGL